MARRRRKAEKKIDDPNIDDMGFFGHIMGEGYELFNFYSQCTWFDNMRMKCHYSQGRDINSISEHEYNRLVEKWERLSDDFFYKTQDVA